MKNFPSIIEIIDNFDEKFLSKKSSHFSQYLKMEQNSFFHLAAIYNKKTKVFYNWNRQKIKPN